MKGFERVLKRFAFLFLAGFFAAAATLPLSAQVTIPEDATITSAVFSVYWWDYWPTTFNLHRITADWNEATVTWNTFHPNFDPAVVASFTTTVGVHGWYSADITALVQGWVADPSTNFGIAMRQVYPGETRWNHFHSSEYADDIALRPKLVISYTSPSAGSGQVVIQRPEPPQATVFDASIWEAYPNENYNDAILYVVHVATDSKVFEKYSLVRFYFEVTPPPDFPGTGTPGYWMNHPEAWPFDSITIGCVTYTKEQAIALMKMPVSNDVTYVMFSALVAAELNVAIGNDASCISSWIGNAQAWLCAHQVGSGVQAGGRTSPWRQGEGIYLKLDAYNNGLLCAPSRDLRY